MTELRWILILLGVLLIAAVYVIGRRRSRPAVRRFEPRFPEEEDRDDLPVAASPEFGSPFAESNPTGDDSPDEWIDPVGDHTEPLSAEKHHDREPAREAVANDDTKIIAVRVAARSSTRFRGEDVVRLLNEEGLKFGKYGIFHRLDDASDASVFSVASMVEPGSFDLAAIETEQIPGVTLFMTLPGPADGIAALDDMLGAAQRLAEHLNGEVLDQTGSTLSRQRAGNLRDEIIAFQHQLALQRRQLPAGKRRRRLI